ncbi:3'-5' exonuclease family protein [Noviherbaspirillum sp.]|uniref:3'-5' exonuclease family protein n=1 Tax=Noviherbaspirillum sp. TaxID=1926288 RepID=UPI002B49D0CA|nr:exonuclease domain-containing protein [Noviherbaspirillum sp.]HJV82958.1 exonuclease domain-containing protein [Noviherbaspirillum sp.]
MLNHYSKLIFIDLETTGPNPLCDRITEIGMVEVSAAGVQRWTTLVNPEMPIPPFIQQLTGINDDMVRHAPTIDTVRDELVRRLGDGLFIAHNARFDYGFLRHAFKRFGMHLHCEVLCTVKLSRKLFPNEIKHSLDALVERHKLAAHTRHRALADADLLWQFWRKLEATLPAEMLLDSIQELLHRPNLPAHLDPDLLHDLPDGPGVYVFYGEHDVPLHVGKAAHLRQRILSHFHTDHPSYKDMHLARQVRRLEWHETAGDVGAQLLHAQLSKGLQPVHDCGQHRETELCSWQLLPDASGALRPVLVYARDVDFCRAQGLHGLFTSREKARAALHALAEQHGLCLAMLGLAHRPRAGEPCVASRAQRCMQECVDKGRPDRQQERLLQALSSIRIQSWPYGGPVAIVEAGADGRRDMHVVDHWGSLGTVHEEHDVQQLLLEAAARPDFDLDNYKILSRALKLGKVEVRPLHSSQAARVAR